jgi:predicted O-methyltransferase YrrM
MTPSRTDTSSPEPQAVLSEAELRELASGAETRADMWVSIVNALQARDVAEIGVYRGDFAARLLRDCPSISRYYMVDPWRHLDDWNKPANRADDVFERFFQEVLDKTSAHEEKRVVLRGRTSEVVDQVPDEGLDFTYIDGDHTLRGITIDLVRVWPKVRDGGWIGGDDFRRSIWQHGEEFEPTLVFPFAVYFAEAVGARVYGLPKSQFLIEKRQGGGYAFVDLTGRYRKTELRAQLAPKSTAAKLGARLKRRLT